MRLKHNLHQKHMGFFQGSSADSCTLLATRAQEEERAKERERAHPAVADLDVFGAPCELRMKTSNDCQASVDR